MAISYSIAIRTLGTAGDKFRRELETIARQSVQPQRVIAYIAQGYKRPEFQIGNEEYVYVRKGMVAQRALQYDEIDSDCILMLDDDVLLAPDSAERMIEALQDNGADCVGADIFQNHKMPLRTKISAALTNLVFPHCDKKWAFKQHRNGSFSYQSKPAGGFCPSHTCGGPAMLWRKDAFLRMSMQDELWLDALGFAYGDDALESYKLHANGGRLGVLYGSGITNLDAGTSSGSYKRSPERFRIRTQAMYMTWYRSLYRNGADNAWSRSLAAAAFGLKMAWIFTGLCLAAPFIKTKGNVYAFIKGLSEGRKAVHSEPFRSLPPYVLNAK